MAQDRTDSQPVAGPVFLGQLESAGGSVKDSRAKANQLAQGLLVCFFLFASLGLCCGAVLHRQFACLPWMLIMWLPIVLLARLSSGAQEITHSDGQVVLQVDRLTQRTREGDFGRIPLKKAEIVWLTQDGLYTRHKRLLPWEAFLTFSLEDGILAEGLNLSIASNCD